MFYILFIVEGTVQAVFEHEDQDYPYHTFKTGDIIGLEDLIYRMQDDVRYALNDEKIFFSDHKVKFWPKRKFKLKFSEDFFGYELSMRNHLSEMQKKFFDICDEFFLYQLKNFKMLLYNRL